MFSDHTADTGTSFTRHQENMRAFRIKHGGNIPCNRREVPAGGREYPVAEAPDILPFLANISYLLNLIRQQGLTPLSPAWPGGAAATHAGGKTIVVPIWEIVPPPNSQN